MTKIEEIYNQLVELFGAVDKQPKNINAVFSKRQLDIAKEAEKRYLGRPEHQYYSAEDLAKAFRDAADWADAHPVNVWHDTSEEPNKYEYILFEYVSHRRELKYFAEYVTKNTYGMLQEFEKFGKCRWAYIKDLLPKECEKLGLKSSSF